MVCVKKKIKYSFAFCAVGDAGEKGTFDSIVNLKYSGSEIVVSHSNLLWPPNLA
jgi:hypothetical protein